MNRLIASLLAGDGQSTCTATAALSTLPSLYVTDGDAKIACTQGQNLAYPVGAPGFVYDPTGSVQASPAHAVSFPRPLPCSQLPSASRHQLCCQPLSSNIPGLIGGAASLPAACCTRSACLHKLHKNTCSLQAGQKHVQGCMHMQPACMRRAGEAPSRR